MNKVATISLSAFGLAALFATAFVGFAKVNGTPLHSLPVIGGMFPEEHAADGHGAAPGHDDPHATSAGEHGPAAGPRGTDAHPDEHATQADGHATTPSESAAGHAAPGAGDAHAASADPHAEDGAHGGANATPPSARPRTVQAGVFAMLDGDALYGQDELRALADSLRAKNKSADQRIADVERREDLLQDRLTAMEERRRTLEDYAKQLEAREREVAAREAEAKRDDAAAAGQASRSVPPGELASFFADGEIEVLVQRLTGFTAADAAEILARLSPARAKELLDALPTARWREFAEAYAAAVQKTALPEKPRQ